jgi:hypothetical protein
MTDEMWGLVKRLTNREREEDRREHPEAPGIVPDSGDDRDRTGPPGTGCGLMGRISSYLIYLPIARTRAKAVIRKYI